MVAHVQVQIDITAEPGLPSLLVKAPAQQVEQPGVLSIRGLLSGFATTC